MLRTMLVNDEINLVTTRYSDLVLTPLTTRSSGTRISQLPFI
jgi:hypothetical protein